jgi:hypothetical protein
MNFPVCVAVSLMFVALGLPVVMAGSRTWTATDGREMVGEFVKFEDESVSVRRENGKVVVIPLAMLSAADREFIEAEKAAAEEKQAEKNAKGSITYKLSGGSENWPEDRKKAITRAMDEAVLFYNTHCSFKKELTANNSPGTPTADANYSGWINWGGTISRRVAIHEIAHTLGIGTHENWGKNIKDGLWTGKYALEQLREFDGKDAVLHADRMHFWPYGLNFDNESDSEKDLRHVKMVAAMRKDMGVR